MKQIMIIATMLFSLNLAAQSVKTDTIKTNAQCGDCEERIENGLNFMKGVKFAELDLEANHVIVRYKTKTTNLDAIRTKLTEIGYDADHMKANQEAQQVLPLCCQPGGGHLHTD